jgi:methylated-DNA-[protein]-cysteine S-methyltransferase
MTIYIDTFSTPLGPFSVAVNPTGAVVATAFGPTPTLRRQFKKCHPIQDPSRTAAVRRQIGEYFAGRRRGFDLALAPEGTPFQHRVWRALQRLPFGRTTTYGALAVKLKHPGAARAVGRANATNPICLIVPCHRVIGADGSLTGFAFGEDIKRQLLEHEGAL